MDFGTHQSQQQMSCQSQVFGVKKKTYSNLEKIREECKNNQRGFAVPTSYKPLLLNLSQSYHRRIEKTKKVNTSRELSRSKTSRADQKVPSTHKASYTLPHTFFNINSKTKTKTKTQLNASNNFFITHNFLSTCEEVHSTDLFLRKLYDAKMEDLKIQPNNRQRQIFLTRLKDKVSEEMVIAPQCDLGVHSVVSILKYFRSVGKLKILNLDRNPLGDEGTIKLSEIISIFPLQDLSVVCANMSSRGGAKILQSMVGHKTLKNINLSSPDGFNRNKIGNQSLAFLTQVLSNQNCVIQNLQLANVGMGQLGFLSFCTGIKKSPQCLLKYLNLSSNQIKISEQNRKYVKMCLQRLSVAKLQLQNNQIGDIGADILGYILGTLYGRSEISTNLEYLDISRNQIRSMGLDQLCSGLCFNKKLTQLLLSGNKLGDGECFYKFKFFLSSNWTIKRLGMRSCLGPSSNLKLIAEGLRKNRSVYFLDISHNLLQVEDVHSLFEELDANNVMQILKMENCNIGDNTIQRIQGFLRNKCPLREINLGNNLISDRGGKKILKLLMEKHRIVELNLKKNCISLHILQQIGYHIKDNKIMFENRNEDPQLQYYEKAVSRQQQKKQTLVHAISQLQQKSTKMKIKNTIQNLINKQSEINQMKNEYQKEESYIKELETKLISWKNKQNQQNIHQQEQPFQQNISQ